MISIWNCVSISYTVRALTFSVTLPGRHVISGVGQHQTKLNLIIELSDHENL
jgi:hypothetical protein